MGFKIITEEVYSLIYCILLWCLMFVARFGHTNKMPNSRSRLWTLHFLLHCLCGNEYDLLLIIYFKICLCSGGRGTFHSSSRATLWGRQWGGKEEGGLRCCLPWFSFIWSQGWIGNPTVFTESWWGREGKQGCSVLWYKVSSRSSMKKRQGQQRAAF